MWDEFCKKECFYRILQKTVFLVILQKRVFLHKRVFLPIFTKTVIFSQVRIM